MKKFIALLSSFAMAAALVGCSAGTKPEESSAPASEGVSGTFEGTSTAGIGGEANPVKVTLTLENSVITDLVVEGPGETEGIGTKAIDSLPSLIVENNSINVDVVSSATMTSTAIIEATSEALKAAGLNPEDYMAAVSSESVPVGDVTLDTDVVVVGAGGAGMIAAIVAADAGKNVVILESQAIAGGNSVRSTGGMNAADTPYEDSNKFGEAAGVEKTLASAAGTYADNETITSLAAAVKEQWDAYQAAPEGYYDSVELMQLDTMIGGKGINDPELVKVLAEKSADAIEWLGSVGAELHNVAAFGGASVKRIHRPVNAEGKVVSVGAYVVPILEKAVTERNIDVRYNTTAKSILTDADGAATGIEAETADGSKVTVNAKSVVLATGGFGYNLKKVAELKPSLDGFCTTNAAGAMGQGIEMAEAVGAATVDMDQIQIHPTVHLDENKNASLITEGLRGDGAILVNAEGKRFTDEVGTRDAVSAAELEQTDGFAWLIVDQAMADASDVIKGYISKGFTVKGETYEELAEAMGVDAAAFAQTMADWKAVWDAKSDAEFGRTSFASEIDLTKAPFYALTVTPGIHHTMGGVKINANTEVLKEDGTAIPNLFAAGEVTGGVHGANRLGGNAVADFAVFGRLAGEAAAANAK